MPIAGGSHRGALAALLALVILAPPTSALAAPPWGTTTDWRIGRVWTLPMDPSPGIPVLFLAEVSASRSDGAFPQEVSIAAYLDGYPIGLGRVLVPGLNASIIFCAGGGWNATPGVHKVRFIADPRSQSNDPNRANNFGEAEFEVGARAPPPGFDFSLIAKPERGSAQPGGIASYAISIAPKGNSTAAVALALFGLPEGASYYLDPPFGKPPFESKLTIYVPERGLGGAPIRAGEHRLTILAMAGGIARRAALELLIGAPAVETTTAASTTAAPTSATTPRPTGPPAQAPAIKISFYKAILLAFAMAFLALAAYYALKERRAKQSPPMGGPAESPPPQRPEAG